MNKLQQLREMTQVVADTGDIEAIARYKPTDATTNPSLLLQAAKLEAYQPLIQDSIRWAYGLGVSDTEALSACCDRIAVGIGREILQLIPERISTEVDARLSFDTRATVLRAQRLIAFYDELEIDRSRILIKIASTWEGIQAAAQLEKQGIQCNLTLLFSQTQAMAAADAGAFLISPFVGRIYDWYKQAEKRDHFEAEEDPGVLSVRHIYNYYKQQGYQTVVMGASFRNVSQITALAGCDRLTISPKLLEELAQSEGTLERRLSPDRLIADTTAALSSEADFRYRMNSDAMATEKLAEGIRLFVNDQVKLEALLRDIA